MLRRRRLALGVLGAFATASAQAAAPAASRAGGPTVRELVVTGGAAQTQTLIDRRVYTVTTDLQSTAGTAADVLNKVPSVDVDADGAVTLRGDGNVTILVDGKPSAQFAGPSRGLSLLQFPAGDIERIEVLTNPPAQYKAEGSGGVINIITRKNRKAGVSGLMQLSGGPEGRMVAALSGAYNVGRLKLSGGVGLRRDMRDRQTLSSRTELDPTSNTLVASRQTTDEHLHRSVPQIRGALDYDLNPRQSFGVSASRRGEIGPRFFDQHTESGPPGAAPASISDRHSDGHEGNYSADAGAHFEQKLARPGETLTLALQRSVTREREGYAYRNAFTLPAAADSFDDLHLGLDLVKVEFSADYILPLSGDRELRLGYDLESDRNGFDNVGHTIDPATGAATVNTAVSNDFRYRQQVNAFYGEYATPIGVWRLQAGLRLEATSISTLLITGNLAGGQSLFGAYPSLHLERNLGENGRLSAAISRRLNRPDPEALNPFADHQDIHNLRAGNPSLKPQDTWAFEAGYSGAAGPLTYGATAYYRLDRNSVTDVLQPVGPDVVLATKANLPRSQSAGLEFTAAGNLGPELLYNLSGNLFYTQIDATALGVVGLRATTGVNLKASLDYRPTADDTFQISFSRTDRRLTPQGAIDAINLLNLGYKRQLSRQVSLVLTFSDVLDGQRQHRVIQTAQLSDDYLRHQRGRVAYLGLVYAFGGQKPAKAGAFDYDQ